MVVRTRRLPRFLASLAGLVALLLTGCKIDGTVEFQADGRAKIDLTFEDSDGTMTKIEQTCEDFRVMFLGKATFIKNPKVEDVTPPGGHTTCRVTSNEPFVGGFGFKENKDTYSFVLPDLHEDTSVFSKFQVRIVVTMPGKVIKASDGKVSGNKVIVDSFNFMSRGISITAQKGQGPSGDKSVGSSGRGSGVSSGSGGFSVWGWVGAGAGAAAVAAVVAFAVGRKKRIDN